ncbi:MAG: hypothetical protein MUF18_20980 [Fimbriiglobus sp.]|nr:hypothetical protein [Fimbriiglobus sp.]
MNSKTRLAILLGGLLGVGGLLAAGWFMLASPYLARLKVVEKAERDATMVEGDVEDLNQQARKLRPLLRRSLPAGPLYPDDPKRTKDDYALVARREYEKALLKLLKDAGARNANVNFADGEANNKAGIPQLEIPNKNSNPTDYLAYTLVAFKIEIPKADLTTIAEVLRRYYSLDILHQITMLTIKQAGTGELGEDKRPLNERSDLKVEIITRAAIVNGAERRNTLTPAPAPLLGVTGGFGGPAYEQSAMLGGKLVPPPLEPILASAPIREYKYLAAKDVYHGSLPQPKPPEVKKPQTIEAEPPPPPKPDFREYIWYTTSFHTIDGDTHKVEVFIRDKANNEDYTLVVTQAGEKVVPKVTKFYYEMHRLNPADRKKKEYMNQETLEISKATTMSNKNNFTVYGVDTDGSLILGERPIGPTGKDDKKPAPGGFGGRPPAKPTLPLADPKQAVAGGLVVMAPQPEKFYRWEPGKNLKQVVELNKAEAEKAIRRAQTRFLPTPTATPTDAPQAEVKGGE